VQPTSRTFFDEERLQQGAPIALWNCNVATHESRAELFKRFCGPQRQSKLVHCENRRANFLGDKNASIEFYREITTKYKFWISPRGNCACQAHRAYEAMHLGMVPIVPYVENDDEIFPPGTPIIRVTDWRVVDDRFLRLAATSNFSNSAMRGKRGAISAISPAYWREKILKHRESWLKKNGKERQPPRSRCWGRVPT